MGSSCWQVARSEDLERKNASLKRMIQVSQTEIERLNKLLKNCPCAGKEKASAAPLPESEYSLGDPRSHAERIISDITQRQDEGRPRHVPDQEALVPMARGPGAFMYDPLVGRNLRSLSQGSDEPPLPAHLEMRRHAALGSAIAPSSLHDLEARLEAAENRVKELEGGLQDAAEERRELREMSSLSNERDGY